MSQPLTDEPMRSSVLDRLHQGGGTGRFAGRQTLSQLVQSVQRDLEQLLNTRYRVSAWPPALEELSRSLVNYGLPQALGGLRRELIETMGLDKARGLTSNSAWNHARCCPARSSPA